MTLAGLVIGGTVLAFTLFAVLFAVKMVFWIVFLPVRLLVKLLWLPFLLVKGLFVGALGLLAVPLLAIVAVVGLLTLVAALLVPLLPLVFLGVAVWLLVRLFRPAEGATTRLKAEG
jgi:hypothetical protein